MSASDPDPPGFLCALTDDPRDPPNFYLNVGSEPGLHNGGETVEVHITLRPHLGERAALVETDFSPGWCTRLMRSDSCIRRLA